MHLFIPRQSKLSSSFVAPNTGRRSAPSQGTSVVWSSRKRCRHPVGPDDRWWSPSGNTVPYTKKTVILMYLCCLCCSCWCWFLCCANHQPFPENLCAHSSVDAGTETQTELKLILADTACEANSRTGMHESQATKTAYPARPLNVNQAGVQKHFRHLRFWTCSIFFIFYFYLFCIAFLHLHFLCICDFLFFCIFFLQLLFVCIFKIHFFCITCCIF